MGNGRINSFEEIYDGALDSSPVPRALFQKAYDGTVIAVDLAESLLRRAIHRHGNEYPIRYPDTDYYLPVILSLSGKKVSRLGELIPILKYLRKRMKKKLSFNNILLCGESTAYAAEIIEALSSIDDDDKPHAGPRKGFLGDQVLRRYGILLLDWTIPGLAILVGKAKSAVALTGILSDLQAKGFLIFLACEAAEQALAAGLKPDIDSLTFSAGSVTGMIHAVNFALRAGLLFGGIAPGARDKQRYYQHRRVRAFLLQLGERDELRTAVHFAAIFFGFPVLVDQKLSEEEQIPDWYISHPDYNTLVRTALEVLGIKLKSPHIPVPFAVDPAFTGDAVRQEDMYMELGGNGTLSFELVTMVGANEIEDGKVEVIGPDIYELEKGATVSGGICIKVYGRRMQPDFAGVLERRIHNFINSGEGLCHTGQRNICCYRISKDCAAKGFRFRHFGDLLIAKIKDVFSPIVDRVQVTVYTDPKAVEEKLTAAKQVYASRDARLAGLSDESADVFYSCAVCQSLSPNHICVITPERPGLCGAVSWLDARASNELDPSGPNQLIKKEGLIDKEKGIWKSVNDFVFSKTNGKIEICSLYSFLHYPMTSCRFFECILSIVPEANGVMITTREHNGPTPCGMNFPTLAGFVGIGVQTPGFLGHGRRYILSKKFIKAEGGLARVIWMPGELKAWLGDDLRKSAGDQGLGAGFVDKIADETIGTTIEEIIPFLEEKKHPALTMLPLI